MDWQRYQQQHLDAWHQDGAVVVPNFFTAEEIAPIGSDYARLYGLQGAGDGTPLRIDTGGPAGAFHPKQFVNLDTLPFDASPEMNLISLHPALIKLAQDLLGCEEIHLYGQPVIAGQYGRQVTRRPAGDCWPAAAVYA